MNEELNTADLTALANCEYSHKTRHLKCAVKGCNKQHDNNDAKMCYAHYREWVKRQTRREWLEAT